MDSVPPTHDFQKLSRRKPIRRDENIPDRMPPHSQEAEAGVLGCCLLSPKECIAECVEKIPESAFYDLNHQTIFVAMEEMFTANQTVDTVTLSQRLKDRGQLEAVGGLNYLARLPDAAPSAANLSHYIEIVIEKYAQRRLIQSCTNIVADVYENGSEVQELFDKAQVSVLRLGDIFAAHIDCEPKPLVEKSIAMIEEYHSRQGACMGIASGFPDLDRMTGGFKAGEMIVIAARPSLGKTSLAMNIADHVAVENRLPVGIFSLEMTAESLMTRMLCSRARVNLRCIQDGFLSERDFPKLTIAAGKLANAPLYIDESCGISVLQLRAKAMRLYQKYGIKLLIVDYLQLLHSTNKKADNRQQEVADISAGVKNLAKELKVPVIVLSQLNRELEQQKSRKPKMSQLRESGQIEADADFVGLLYRPKADDEENGSDRDDAEGVSLFIAKQRSGPTGTVNFTFIKGYTRFESVAKIDSEDYLPTQKPEERQTSWQDKM